MPGAKNAMYKNNAMTARGANLLPGQLCSSHTLCSRSSSPSEKSSRNMEELRDCSPLMAHVLLKTTNMLAVEPLLNWWTGLQVPL